MRLVAKLIPEKAKVEELEHQFPDFKPYYFEAIQGLFNLSNELEKAMDQYFSGRCEKFSRARFLVLMVIYLSDGSRTNPNEIAKKLAVTRGNMTGLVDCLIEDGYVKKDQDLDDRRQVWLQITPEGKKLLHRILPEYFKRIASFMSSFKREEILQFSSMLARFESEVAPSFQSKR